MASVQVENEHCWCGTTNPAFNDEGLEESCGGTGFLNCFCGGDQCACHYHGGVGCDGCEDCEGYGDGEGDFGWAPGDDEP